jgi:nitrate reductase assembly molybdenum cofactor insertion protein NarJ
MDLSHYDLLAELFWYPDLAYADRVKPSHEFLAANHPDAAGEMDAFVDLFPFGALREMEELFTRSFDVQSVTTLDVGYVLFGEDYKRGELLANLNREHNEAGVDCRNELADHLPNLLRLLAIIGNEPDKAELVEELVVEILAPALRQMIAEFDPERLREKDECYLQHYKTLIETPGEYFTAYSHCLRAVNLVLSKDFSLEEKAALKPPMLEQSLSFLRSVRQEMEIEDNEHSE